MKFKRNPAFWTSTILHLVVLVALLLVTLVEAFLPKEQPHVFEMVSEPLANENTQQSRASLEPVPDFSLPEVQPLEIPQPVVSNRAPVEKPVERPVEQPVEPAKSNEPLMSYEDFIKKNPIKQPKTQRPQPSRPNIKVPTINTEKFGINLQSSLTTADESVSSTLTAVERTALQRYGDQLNSRLNRAWIKPEKFSGINLVTTIVFDVSSSGRISNIRLRPGSGNPSFDESVKAAFLRVGSGGVTPTGQGHTFTMSFKIMN
ncbi:MAG: outer membrane biosynthesis protein TonB [Lentimonas sp.]|jgi:outer membrane biosynthesis protein TonB